MSDQLKHISKLMSLVLRHKPEEIGCQHVHLSEAVATANSVGSRHGKVAILIIDAKKMQNDGFKFYLSDNNVWLTESVPVQYISR